MPRSDPNLAGASSTHAIAPNAAAQAMPRSSPGHELQSPDRPAAGGAPGHADVAIEFEDVVAGYKDFMVLDRLSFKARRGAITLLLGPNGAGKSTVLKALFGLLDVRGGRIRVEGRDVTRSTPRELLAQGIAFVPQGRNLFGQLTVFQNLELGGITLGKSVTHERIPQVLELFPRVRERLHNQASTLSGGEQKQLEIARALLLRPRVILIDEPSIGLSPLVVRDVFALLRRLVGEGTTVLMVEQNVKTALKVSDDAIALESGRLVLHRPADELLADPHIERLFLGSAAEVGAAGARGAAARP